MILLGKKLGQKGRPLWGRVNCDAYRREDSAGSVITGETGLAHAGTVVNNQGSNFVFLKMSMGKTKVSLVSIASL